MGLPEPYYERDGITIYHADCADVLPSIDPASVDLLLTDPPYGIDYQAGSYWNGAKVEGDAGRFDVRHLLVFPRLVLWGANHYCHDLPESNGWIIWNKRDRTSRELPGSDVEMAWSNVSTEARLYTRVWMPHTIRGEAQYHPTQKPVSLMRWIIDQWTEPGDLVLDPYMGSGPIAQACKDLGRRYIGVEIVEEYCEVAVNRLAQGVLSFGEGVLDDTP